MENINIVDIINKWFEIKYQTYDKLETDDSIYLYYKGDEYIDIMIDKKYKSIYYKMEFYEEFSEIFSIEYRNFGKFIIDWVEDTFNLDEFTSSEWRVYCSSWIEIPKQIKNEYGEN